MSGIDKDFARIVVGLKRGGVMVLPTDTIYGLHALAMRPEAVEKVYQLKKRDPGKPLIVLVGGIDDLARFSVGVDAAMIKYLEGVWPGRVSVVVDCADDEFGYLHRGTGSVAFRMPARADLLRLVKEAGPLVSSSVNVEGEMFARTVGEAKRYFGDEVDGYVDDGRLDGLPSKVVRYENGEVKVLREG